MNVTGDEVISSYVPYMDNKAGLSLQWDKQTACMLGQNGDQRVPQLKTGQQFRLSHHKVIGHWQEEHI